MKHNLATAIFKNPYPQTGEIIFPDMHINIHGYPCQTTGWPPRPVDKSFLYLSSCQGPQIIEMKHMDNLNPTAWTRENLIFYLLTNHAEELERYNIEYVGVDAGLESIDLPDGLMD